MDKLLTALGPVTAVIGAQWGDEGKGKVIDILTEHFDVIARASGGANAGHTIVVDGEKHVFHLLPAGSLHPGKPIFLGAGMVIHLPTLLEEIETLEKAGISVRDRLVISQSAHILFEFHKEIDAALEAERSKGGASIGTTKRGIGPAYMDKAERRGIRMGILADFKKNNLQAELNARKEDLQKRYGISLNTDQECDRVEKASKLLASCIDTGAIPHLHASLGKRILIEGAQATLLDLDHGTYPFVTSSNTTAAGALQGLGLPPKVLTGVIGVAKAYCTRVGGGDFLTEVMGKTGDRLREKGGEYGATTGRPRRCGWLHLPDLQMAAAINGCTCWNITKLDVLDEEETIPVGIGEKNGKPVYKELPGWKTSTVGITSFNALPKQAQQFIAFIEKETKVPVSLIGTGPGREQMIVQ